MIPRHSSPLIWSVIGLMLLSLTDIIIVVYLKVYYLYGLNVYLTTIARWAMILIVCLIGNILVNSAWAAVLFNMDHIRVSKGRKSKPVVPYFAFIFWKLATSAKFWKIWWHLLSQKFLCRLIVINVAFIDVKFCDIIISWLVTFQDFLDRRLI